ncbi:MAG: hypothetical protein RL226_672 [Bacteroidota bacterium]|jgi:ribonuclease Z
MTFDVTILGCGAATPTLRHNPSAQLVNLHDKLFLIDCGEGTQTQLRRYKIKFQRIEAVFISHLHGDHYFGLMGLLSSMHLLGRKKAIHLFGPSALKQILDIQMNVGDMHLSFDIVFHPINPKTPEIIFEDNTIEVSTIPLTHRIDCTGFLFSEKPRPPKVSRNKIAEFNLSLKEIVQLKHGEGVERDGKIIPSNQLTLPQAPPRRYAYCSDTKPSETVVELVHGVDLLYHEATFLHVMEKRAKETFHTTAKQAGEIALRAGVKRLVVGHFSSRYNDDSVILEEAKSVFEQTACANEGEVFSIPLSTL